MHYLGIDLGTSSVKVLVIDDENTIVGDATREYPVDFPQDKWAEQSPIDWWEGTVECIQELVEKDIVQKDSVKAMSFSGQMHGLVALDEDNEVLQPAILWCDNRTEEECDVSNCSYATCAKRRLLPGGVCGETLKRKTKEIEPEEAVGPPVKLKGKVSRRVGEKEIF